MSEYDDKDNTTNNNDTYDTDADYQQEKEEEEEEEKGRSSKTRRPDDEVNDSNNESRRRTRQSRRRADDDDDDVDQEPVRRQSRPADHNEDEPKPEPKKKSSVGKINLKSVGKQGGKGKISNLKKTQLQESNDYGSDTGEKKVRRRNKDAAADILNVIDWKLDGGDKYKGSETVPDSEIRKTQKSQDEEEQMNEAPKQNENHVEPEPEPINETSKTPKNNAVTKSQPVKVTPKISKQNHIADSKLNDDELRNEDEEEVFNEKDTKKLSPSSAEKRKVQVRGKSLDEERAAENADKSNNNENDKVVSDEELKESLDFLNRTPNVRKVSQSNLLNSLMDTYLDKDYVNRAPTLQKPKSRTESEASSRKTSASDDLEKMDELERNLKNIRAKNKKQPPPPVRNKPNLASRTWEDPREQQRLKVKEKQWPPKEPPKDVGAYIVESYGQTDPYTKRLIKDIQRAKREEEERLQAEKRAEIVSDNTKPVSTLRDTFTNKPVKSGPGTLRPEVNLSEDERSWIRHEKKQVIYDETPEEPDWMTLIRNRRWKSTVKARFPCKSSDRTDFERRSTTPKNWKKLAKDKNALKMLGEIVGIGAEGEELFLRLANQRQKIEEEREAMDSLAEQEILAYQVARESIGEDAAYSLQMDNPLPAARMKQLQSTSSEKDGDDLHNLSTDALASYPFTTSQLEAAYLSNQLLRLHPEEFRKLISLERSRQATLRWQFSADPFDSVHEHQSLPYEMALLASDEPRVLQAMRKIVAQGGDDYRSVFSSTAPTPTPRSRARSEGGFNNYYANYESDGYESSNSVSSSSSVGVVRGRPRKKKKPVPLPNHARGRSVSPSMLCRAQIPVNAGGSQYKGPTLKVPTNTRTYTDDDNREVQAHSLFDDADLQLGDEIANMDKLTSNLSRDIDEELKGIEASLEDRKKGFFEEAIRNEKTGSQRRASATEDIDTSEISSRRKDFLEKDLQSSAPSDVSADLPKTRHKVRRINSNAQLNAVFGGRRQMSEVDAENEGDNTQQQRQTKNDGDTSKELSNVLNDINNTYGD